MKAIILREVVLPIVIFVSVFCNLHYVPKEHLLVAILGSLGMMVGAYVRGITYERYSPYSNKEE